MPMSMRRVPIRVCFRIVFPWLALPVRSSRIGLNATVSGLLLESDPDQPKHNDATYDPKMEFFPSCNALFSCTAMLVLFS